MRQPLVATTLAVLFATAGLQAQACDARKAALRMFSSQGLNLLRPARSYIKPGGLIIVPKGGIPEYDDPPDTASPDDGTFGDFRAVILQETERKTTGFSTALGIANWVLPVAIGLSAAGDSQVSLAQIETSGQRLDTNRIEDLIKPGTRTHAAALRELKARRGHRFFIVQEVHTAKSLDLQATNTKNLNVTFNDGKAVADCSTKPEKPGETVKPVEGAKPGEASKKAQESKSGEATTGSGAAPTAAQAGKDANASAAEAVKFGVSVCRGNDVVLRMNTINAIPFAVRLVEVELEGGVLQRRRGASLTMTLGDEEVGAALIDPDEPAVSSLKPRNVEQPRP